MFNISRQSVVCSCFILLLSGCLSVPSRKCTDTGCETGQCQSCSQGNGCESCENGCSECKGPKRWSPEWYAIESETPVGAPQKLKKGKLWPPFSRPNGKRQQFSHRFHAAHYWPHPYNCEDIGYVRQVLARQEQQGWTEETTLYEYHFNAETHELNHAGERHLQWILEYVPIERRTVWVQKSIDSLVNQQRMAHVQHQASLISQDSASIALRVASPTGRPALEINAIRLAEIQSMPEPRVEYNALPTDTGSGG